ncbi:MAG: MFS transporter [Bacilli bacterium]|jgi:MFS family permease
MKLNVKRTFLVGFAFLIISLFWQVYDGTMSIILVTHFGLNQAWSGVLLALDNLLALFLLPLFGAWSDKTVTKYGKRKPYILIGTIVAAVVFVLLAVVDFYQLQAMHAADISNVLQDAISGNYYFTVGAITQITDPVREVVSTARADYIFANITQTNWYFLATFIGILFIVLMAMCSFRTPAVSLMPDVVIKPHRSKANAIINAMGTIGGGLSLGSIAIVGTMKQANYETFSFLPLFAVTAGLMLVLLAVFMFVVKEVKWSEEMRRQSIELGVETAETENVAKGTKGEKMPKDVRKSFLLILASVVLWFFSYNAASSKITLYSTEVLGIENYSLPVMIGFVAALIAFYPVGIISTKIGRRTTIMGGIGILILGFIFGFVAGIAFFPGWLVFVAMAFVGVGWAAINVNSYPMVVEMSHGANIGVYTGYYYSASMFAQILTPIISGLIMDAVGMRWSLFPYSIIFAVAALVTMFFVKHGEAKKLEPIKPAEEIQK